MSPDDATVDLRRRVLSRERALVEVVEAVASRERALAEVTEAWTQGRRDNELNQRVLLEAIRLLRLHEKAFERTKELSWRNPIGC